MKVEIDGASIRTESDLHRILSAELGFGPYYGENLSALWDRLSTDVERPVELVWKDSEESRKSLGHATFGKIRQLLLDVRQQDEASGLVRRFTVVFESATSGTRPSGECRRPDRSISARRAGLNRPASLRNRTGRRPAPSPHGSPLTRLH